GHLLGGGDLQGGDLAAHPGRADDAHRRVGFARAVAEGGVPQGGHLRRQGGEGVDGVADPVGHPDHGFAEVLFHDAGGRAEAEEARLDVLALDVGAVAVLLGDQVGGDLRLEGDLLALAVDDDRHLLAGAVPDEVGEGGPVLGAHAVERDDAVARLHAGRLGRGLGVGRGALVAVLALGDDARRDRADGGGLLLDPEAHEDGEEQRHGQDEVHEGAGEHDDDPFPRPARVEQALVVAGLQFLEGRRAGVLDHAAPRGGGAGLQPSVGSGREHADHADVAAERDGLDAVLGLAPLPRPQGRAEADHVLRHADAEHLGRRQVAQFVPGDGEQQADREDDYAEDEHQGRHARASALAVRTVSSRTRARAQVSASRTSDTVSEVPGRGVPCSSTTRVTVSMMPLNGSVPARKASTHSSLAALNTAGAVPASSPTCRARFTEGNASLSRGKNSQVDALLQSKTGAASGTLSGQPRPMAMGPRMSGGVAWASVDPSVNSTIEGTYDCGCTTTSMPSKGMSYSRCASITSRPLLTRFAETIVITSPMAQAGWARASSTVTSASSARVRPRKGPPEAVTTSLRTSARVPAASAWNSAACSESTGMI